MNSNSHVILFSGLTIVLWGLWGFFGKLALERKMAAPTIFLIETLIITLISIPLFFYWYKAQSFSLDFNAYGVCSGVVLAAGLLFYYLALAGGQVSIIVPLTSTYPVVAVLLGYVILNERPSFAQWLGILLVITGSVLLLSSSVRPADQ